jgi:hypothetical protein
MTSTEQARAALGAAGVVAPTDRQIEQTISRAALHAIAHAPLPWALAALEVAEESR